MGAAAAIDGDADHGSAGQAKMGVKLPAADDAGGDPVAAVVEGGQPPRPSRGAVTGRPRFARVLRTAERDDALLAWAAAQSYRATDRSRTRGDDGLLNRANSLPAVVPIDFDAVLESLARSKL